MGKFNTFACSLVAALVCVGAFGAANVLVPKKADSVAKRDASTSTTAMGASLLPTAVNLVTSVIQLNQQQKALTAECEPTSREITFVNNMIKEWANAGGRNPLNSSSGVRACGANEDYAMRVREVGTSIGIDNSAICWDVFKETEARNAVWAGYPKASVAEYCSDGTDSLSMCSKNSRKKVTNMWTLFDMIDFENKDYTQGEASQAAALLEKAAKCSTNKLAAKRLETFGGFITNTINNVGKPTNTESIMGAVSGVVGQTGLGNIGGIANVAAQFLDK